MRALELPALPVFSLRGRVRCKSSLSKGSGELWKCNIDVCVDKFGKNHGHMHKEDFFGRVNTVPVNGSCVLQIAWSSLEGSMNKSDPSDVICLGIPKDFTRSLPPRVFSETLQPWDRREALCIDK